METWAAIKGYEEFYQISTLGRVWSKHTKKYLKPFCIRGYQHVSLILNGKIVKKKVHRLVAEAFLDNPLNKETVNHLNENKLDNQLINLEWATSRENTVYGTGQKRSGLARRKMVESYNPENGERKVYNGVVDAVARGYNRTAVQGCCRGERKTHKGLVWRYL